jgi:hypothetical protein
VWGRVGIYSLQEFIILVREMDKSEFSEKGRED